MAARPSRHVPQVTTQASKVRYENISRICESRMVSRSTVRAYCSVFALAWAGNPQHRKGGGSTTRVPLSASRCSAAIEMYE